MSAIKVLSKNKIYGPTIENPNIALTYPRLIEIMHNEENKGTLLITGESLDIEGYRIHRSKDGGSTWEHIATVTETLSPELVANWQPHLYELPNAVGDMPKGTIILSGCTRDRRVAEVTKMSLWRSYDCGESWEEFSVAATGGDIHCGLYEPFCICDDEGKLFCFYSDETKAEHSQMLVCKWSNDGINWSDRIEVVACKEPHLRPGMISIGRMSTGEYALAYEMIAEPGCPTYVKTTAKLDDWGDPAETGYKIFTKDGKGPSQTPYINWFAAGGENGTLIASGWHEFSQEKQEQAALYVSFDLGKTWEKIENPLPYPWPAKHRFSYSPCFAKGRDESIVYYVNAVPAEVETDPQKADFVLCKIKIGE